eukprot:scaffold34140_cov62-Phaeocystis_antarctica.AAC.1
MAKRSKRCSEGARRTPCSAARSSTPTASATCPARARESSTWLGLGLGLGLGSGRDTRWASMYWWKIGAAGGWSVFRGQGHSRLSRGAGARRRERRGGEARPAGP